ncbi:hypothetical protein KC19_1G136500 [Ceratodon purpureus]|uniref:poly(ADP-ribose) glycohydrolase n=1 Tax=Ceratodon purpureus TaxID=3225 RepID=A0A8T0J7U7_CERPU|nr:hypothetical protein KC19_1G136500 [Ceratodon purpureus]
MVLWEEFLPVEWEESEGVYKWSNGLRGSLKRLSGGPEVSDVCNGLTFAEFLSQVAHPDANPEAADGLEYYFDEVVESAESMDFFDKTLPKMADLALRLPELLLEQIEQRKKMVEVVTDSGECDDAGVLRPLSLQILHPQQPGIILITQELAASILSCAFFCLFPVSKRDQHRLPAINMDTMLAGVWGRASQIHKVHCLRNYFKRVCESMPQGSVSYERKVLPLPNHKVMEAAFWSGSHTPLCSFEISDHGIIEDAGWEYAQVDFANKFLGGGALRLGCVQEEIRFMLSPELIVGMLFLPAMAENETIEITGSERFSNYAGYAGKFRYAGNFVDSTPRDAWGRRYTKIIPMDAKARPGESQFQEKILLREACKAYCGFLSTETMAFNTHENSGVTGKYGGIATGNWGCGAFGGDLPVKSMLQWLAASEAGWPTVKYYTFQDQRAERLSEAVHHIVEKKYDVGQLWSAVLKYGELRHSKDVHCDFFTWLLKDSTLHPAS